MKTVSKAYDVVTTQDPYEASKSETLAIDDGYIAKYALVQHASRVYGGASLSILVGTNYVDALGTVGYYDMADEVASVPIAIDTWKVDAVSPPQPSEIFCERTDRAYDAWKIKTHAAITQAYLAKQQAYEQALAQAEAAAGVVIAGRNPIFNAKLVADELRKQCITFVTAQQFDAFGALTLTGDGYAQPNLARSAAQMPYVRFFEQAFEWEHIVYFFYPYFWGWKPGWKNRMLLDDVDPRFGDFLRAGAARVVFPVRPGFEAAVVHYLETGEIWNGGPPPDISSSLYVPIIQEIQEATGAPGSEVAQGDPWEVRLPTTLVRIRPNDDMPVWQKVGDVGRPRTRTSSVASEYDDKIHLYALANPGDFLLESDAVTRAVLEALEVPAAPNHRVRLSQSAWLDYTVVDELWTRRAPPALPSAEEAQKAAEAMLASSSAPARRPTRTGRSVRRRRRSCRP